MRPAALVEARAAQGRRVEVPGAGTSVWEQGDGPPVVCIHGVPVSSFEYRALLPERSPMPTAASATWRWP